MMRRKLFMLLFTAAVLPILGILIFLHFLTLNQQQELAQRRLSSVVSGVIGFYDRTGIGVLSQVKALTENDDLKRTLLLTDEIGFIDQASLIKNTKRHLMLLNLDYLTITDPRGEALAQGHDQSVFGFHLTDDLIVGEALTGQPIHSLGMRDIKGNETLMVLAASPVWFKDRAIGVVLGGIIIDESYLDDLKALSGAELILLRDGLIKGSTIPGNLNQLPVDTTANVFSSIELGGIPYKFSAYALRDFSGEKVADLMIGISTYDLVTVFDRVSLMFIIFAGISFLFTFGLAWGFSYRITHPISELAEASSRLATGDFDVEMTTKNRDEIGKLVASFNSMAADLREYREKLINTERMTAFTQMAQKIAHEIKNPLTPIQVSIQDLKNSYEGNDRDFPLILEKSCDTVLEEVSSLARIVKEFSEFARFPSPQPSEENLNELMRSYTELYSGDIESGRLRLDLGDNYLTVIVDRDHLKRAVHNILKNAFEASGETGMVELKTYGDDGYAVIEVTDSGPGFSPLARKNIFSPYFTTKPDGSGLGLVIVKKIITDHEGLIEIDDAAETGTSVKIKLRALRS
jgi:signal transduction histidine kinase